LESDDEDVMAFSMISSATIFRDTRGEDPGMGGGTGGAAFFEPGMGGGTGGAAFFELGMGGGTGGADFFEPGMGGGTGGADFLEPGMGGGTGGADFLEPGMGGGTGGVDVLVVLLEPGFLVVLFGRGVVGVVDVVGVFVGCPLV